MKSNKSSAAVWQWILYDFIQCKLERESTKYTLVRHPKRLHKIKLGDVIAILTLSLILAEAMKLL